MSPAPHPAFSGWRVCGAAVLTQAVAIGFTLGSVGVFAAPLAKDLGATATQFNVGVSVFSLMMNLSMPFIGSQLDRGRIRGVMIGGACLLALSLGAMSQARTLGQVGVCFGVGCAVGMAMLGPMSSSTAMANWFSRLRGRALGIANMGGPAGPIVIAPAAAWAIGAFGWRATLLGFAVLVVAIGVPCVLLGILDRPSDVGQFPDGEAAADEPWAAAGSVSAPEAASAPEAPSAERAVGPATASADAGWTGGQLARCRDFWFLAIAAAPFAGTGIVMSANAIPYMTQIGASPEAAALVVVPQSIGAVAGPVVFGALADRIHPRLLFVGLIAALCAGLGGLVLEPSYAVALGLFTVIGIVGGSMMAVYGALVARLFGVAAFGQVLGTAALVGMPVLFAMPLLFGAAFDATGSYARGFFILVGTLTVAAILFASLPSGEARRARAA
ncbi:MAG: MFS transporter [Myxococcota bacterium]